MSSGYDDLDVDLDDPGDFGDLDDAEDAGFYRGWTAAQASERECCEHQVSCPSRRRSWWQRLRGAA